MKRNAITGGATKIVAGIGALIAGGLSLALVASGAPQARSTTPAAVQGRWIATTTSATSYWDNNTGRFLGNGSGSGQVYEFDNQGRYPY